jgi:hypothetical protein
LLRGLSVLAALGLVLTVALPAAAHEQRQVGKYTLEVGWRDEPALAGLLNAVEVEVREAATGQGVEGLTKTLKLSVTFGGGRSAFEPALRSLGASDPGHYVADVIPTAPGDYLFRIQGTIGTQDVNELFESGPGRADSVRPASTIAFPAQDVLDPAVARDLRALRETADQSRTIALGALTLGLVSAGMALIALRGRPRTR